MISKNAMGCGTLAAWVALSWPQLLGAQESDCTGWGTPEFFGALHALFVPGSLIRNDDVAGAVTATDVRGCLAKGTEVSVRDSFGHTVLHYASVGANPAIIRALLDAGADVNARDQTGNTPLREAVEWTEYPAGRGANPAVIRVLVDAGADVNVSDQNGFTPLHAAAIWSTSPAVISVLSDAGADVDARYAASGITVLYLAAEGASAAVVAALVKAGADVSARTTRSGETALHAATTDTATLRVLLDAGAAVNARRADGRTPLHVAAVLKESEAVIALLDAGARATERDEDGKTPWDYAVEGAVEDRGWKFSKGYWRLSDERFH